MVLKEYRPQGVLAHFIESYRKIEIGFSENQSLELLDYPSTNMDMVFNLGGQVNVLNPEGINHTVSTHSFFGHFNKRYKILLSNNCQLFNIRFSANGIYPLTKIPLKSLLNSGVDLEQLLGTIAHEIHERLINEPVFDKQVAILDEIFLARLYQNFKQDVIIEEAILLSKESKGLITVSKICDRLNIGYKKIDRLFAKNIGLSPKQFLNTIRFNHIIRDLSSSKDPDWMDFVVNYNFHDQAHFIKEFKKFSGVSPGGFRPDL